jgi:carbon-monoxide dehydrogenase medium subunit
LGPGEILTSIEIPVPPRGVKSAYLKVGQKASGFAIVGVAVLLAIEPKGICTTARIALTGVSDRAYRAAEAEAILIGKRLQAAIVMEASQKVTQGVEVSGDIHASSVYRTHLAKVYTQRALEKALAR